MASRCRVVSKPALNFLKSSISKPTCKFIGSGILPRPAHSFSRLSPEMACLQSLLPLHSAVSSARLTSCLGIDSRNSRSRSQELGLSVPL